MLVVAIVAIVAIAAIELSVPIGVPSLFCPRARGCSARGVLLVYRHKWIPESLCFYLAESACAKCKTIV